MDAEKAKILIVEDDIDIADMLNDYFRNIGYQILTVNWGEDGVRACQNIHPDLVILDIRLPDIDGFEVATRLRADRRTKDIPIMFLTEDRSREARLRGLELQAEDYVTKPFDIQELRLRVRNLLQRTRRSGINHPVTELPTGDLVDEHLRHFLADGAKDSLMVVSFKNFGRFRDIYGFVAHDDLLRAAAMIIKDTLQETGTSQGFIGHLTLTDLVLITEPQNMESVKERVATRLGNSLQYFYQDQDRDKDVFRDSPLSYQIVLYIHDPDKVHDVQKLKIELEKLYQQGIS